MCDYYMMIDTHYFHNIKLNPKLAEGIIYPAALEICN